MDDDKIEALKQAARQGWADLSAGRYVEVGDDKLEEFVAQLGRRAAQGDTGAALAPSSLTASTPRC